MGDNVFAVQQGDAIYGFRCVHQCDPEVPVFDHVAHRAFLDLGVVEMHEKRRGPFAGTPVCYLDLEHRLGIFCHGVPHADTVQQPRRGQRQGIGPPVETGVAAHVAFQPVNDGYPQPDPGQCQTQGGAVQPTADDRDICVKIHMSKYVRASGIVHARNGRYRPFR